MAKGRLSSSREVRDPGELGLGCENDGVHRVVGWIGHPGQTSGGYKVLFAPGKFDGD